SAKDANRMLAADRLFHKGLWQAAGHALLLVSLGQLSQRQMVMWSVVRDALAFDVAQSEHEDILAAIEAEDLKTAERRLSYHVRWLAREDLKEALTAAREMRARIAKEAMAESQPASSS
ncbi:FCD domain-containing protein, partial [Roseomonas mucosa]|uniref:FCD domain-containing protein n=1 Tax=Roseomonas mucosa TaxID=207340 RepID=UPI0028CCFD47